MTDEAQRAPVPASRATGRAGRGRQIAYTLARVSRAVQVELRVRGAPSGTTAFLLEEWGGIADPEVGVSDVVVTGAAAMPLAVARPSQRRWEVSHRPGEPLSLRYTLAPSAPTGTTASTYYRPVVRPERFHAVGETALLYPEHLDDEAPCAVRLRWRGFARAGWRLASSFGADRAGFSGVLPLADFRQAVFYAGRLRVTRRPVPGGTLELIVDGDFAFADADLADLAQRVIAAQRDFFGERGRSRFVITVLPLGAEAGGRALGGTSLTRSFALFITEGWSLSAADERAKLSHLLAHELFHQWNGGILRAAEPEERSYWFTEGFTDFYARRLLVRAGLLDLADYARALDDTLAGYYLSPVRDAPNERIEREFWRSPAVARLAYQRGEVVALLLDGELRARGSSLDDLLLELVERGRGGEQIDTERLLQHFRARTSAEFAARIERVIVDGAIAVLPEDLLAPDLLLRATPRAPFAPGFDLETSQRRGEIVGVEHGSAASRAGLRDGQKLRGLSVHLDRPDVPVEVRLGDGEIVRYLPQGRPVLVPQAAPGEGETTLVG